MKQEVMTGRDVDGAGLPGPKPFGSVGVRTAAIVAGIGYVALFVLGVFANFFVKEGLVVSGDPNATVANILDSPGLFRAGMIAFLAVFLLDVIVAWALYIVFRNANRDVSLVAAWARLVYTVFLGVALVFYFQALQLVNGAEYLSVFSADQLNAQAMGALDSFNYTWLIGLAAFGMHLILLGYIIVKSGYGPRVLGFVLAVAGAAYMVDTIANIVVADYASVADVLLAVVAIPSVVAEAWLGGWLIFRAGKPAIDLT